MTEVKGTAGMQDQAAKGMALFEQNKSDEIELDMVAAQSFKSDTDSKINDLNEMIKTLSGKDNAKLRKEKSKEASDLSKTDQYIDAVKVIKGQEPKHGHFIKSRIVHKVEADAKAAADVNVAPEEVKAEKKPEKKTKKEESAGISKAERDELEKLKQSIIELKTQLKNEGMTGGQINKDERVAKMVSRMNELKEKESPGSTTAPKKDDKPKKKLSADQEGAVRKLTEEIEAYRQELVSKFGYSKKDISSDPDMVEMQAELNKLTGKK